MKIGDKVKTDRNDVFCRQHLGKIGVVVGKWRSKYGPCVDVKFDNGTYGFRTTWLKMAK